MINPVHRLEKFVRECKLSGEAVIVADMHEADSKP